MANHQPGRSRSRYEHCETPGRSRPPANDCKSAGRRPQLMKTIRYFGHARAIAGSNPMVLAAFVTLLSAGSLLGQQPDSGKGARSPEFESCKTNLNRIFDAIQEYRKV